MPREVTTGLPFTITLWTASLFTIFMMGYYTIRLVWG
jgi:hypothetical protein